MQCYGCYGCYGPRIGAVDRGSTTQLGTMLMCSTVILIVSFWLSTLILPSFSPSIWESFEIGTTTQISIFYYMDQSFMDRPYETQNGTKNSHWWPYDMQVSIDFPLLMDLRLSTLDGPTTE